MWIFDTAVEQGRLLARFAKMDYSGHYQRDFVLFFALMAMVD